MVDSVKAALSSVVVGGEAAFAFGVGGPVVPDPGGQGEESLSDAVARLYTALGTRRHEKGEASDDASIAAAVAEAGLPESVAAAVDDESLDAAVRAEHEASQAAVGDTAGSPVVALEGRGFFGPVVVPAPTGDQAMQLFEAVRLIAGVPAFSELKTARNPF